MLLLLLLKIHPAQLHEFRKMNRRITIYQTFLWNSQVPALQTYPPHLLTENQLFWTHFQPIPLTVKNRYTHVISLNILNLFVIGISCKYLSNLKKSTTFHQLKHICQLLQMTLLNKHHIFVFNNYQQVQIKDKFTVAHNKTAWISIRDIPTKNWSIWTNKDQCFTIQHIKHFTYFVNMSTIK